MEILLASTSPFRQQQLQNMGVSFQATPPKVDEEDLKFAHANLSPQELCEKLAEAKAVSLLPTEALVIGADQLVHFQGQILGKTADPEAAVEQLMRMQGQCHELITSFCVLSQGRRWVRTNITRLTLRSWTKEALRQYVHLDQSWKCAGAYKFEKGGAALFSSVESSDPTAIIGLPLMALTEIFRELEVPLFVKN